MSRAVAFLAGMGAGYLDSEKRQQDKARQDARDKREQDEFDAKMADRKQADADKQALRDAAAPVAADAAPVAPPIGSMDAPRAPEDQGIRVAGKTYTDKASADAAVAAANTPGAQRKRISAALLAQGKVVEADQLATNELTNKANQIKVDQAQRDEANQAFDSGIRKALQSGGWDGLAQFMSESKADGNDGATQFQATRTPDGKVQMVRVNVDGTTSPIGPAHEDSDMGRATAGLMLSRAVPEADKLKHLVELKRADDAAKHQDGALKVAQQQADTQEQYRKDQAENMRELRRLEGLRLNLERARIDAAKAGKQDAPLQVTLKDRRDFESDLNATIKDLYPVKDGADRAERDAMAAQADAHRALATSLFTNNAQVGIPLTAGIVSQAINLARDRKNVRIAQVNGVPHEGVMVNGTFVLTSGALQPKPQQAAAPAAPGAAPMPAAARASAGVQPAPAAAAAPTPSRTGDATLNGLMEQQAASLQPLVQQLKAAKEQLVAVGRSGDANAVANYTQQVNSIYASLRQQAQQRLGNQADAYMASIGL